MPVAFNILNIIIDNEFINKADQIKIPFPGYVAGLHDRYPFLFGHRLISVAKKEWSGFNITFVPFFNKQLSGPKDRNPSPRPTCPAPRGGPPRWPNAGRDRATSAIRPPPYDQWPASQNCKRCIRPRSKSWCATNEAGHLEKPRQMGLILIHSWH